MKIPLSLHAPSPPQLVSLPWTSFLGDCPIHVAREKLAKMLDELDIRGGGELQPAQGGADDTEERVLAS